jgi:TonB family protein
MSTALLGADSVGRLIDGRFTLLRFLGGTESSSVFLTELGDEPKRKAAIKFISADQVDAEASIAQWEAARTLSHPHLIALLEHGRSELDGQDLLYAVTEYADEVLSEILPERPLTPAETREMLGPILDALAFLHGRDLVHGHLKPSNIMVVNDRLKLSADRLLVAGEPLRRPASSWDAPESGTVKIAPAADLWSLGVVLVQVLTQQPPHWDRGQGAEPEVPASIPEPFFGLARECLRVDPARRLTLSGVQAHLEPAQAAEPVDERVPAQPAEPVAEKNPAQPAAPVAESAAKPSFKTNLQAVVGTLIVIGVALAVMRIGSHHAAPAPSPQPSSPASPVAQIQSPAPAVGTSSGPVVKGEVASRVLPNVPEKIAAAIQGHLVVVVRVQVDTQGNVVQASFDYPGTSRYFANQALNAAEKWKFTPAWVGGRTIASVWILEFHFTSAQTDATAVEESP